MMQPVLKGLTGFQTKDLGMWEANQSLGSKPVTIW